MAFVNETLAEQDKAWFLSFGFRSVFSDQYPIPVPRKWTIDRDRDAVLISLEGQGYWGRENDVPPLFLVLIWQGQVIRIQAFSKGEGNNELGTEKWWRLTYIGIPKALEAQADAVLQLIREALDARGTNYHREIVRAMHIELTTPTFI